MSNRFIRWAIICGAVLLACGAVIFWAEEAGASSEKGTRHVVQKGETVWGIAKKYGVKPEEIIAVNNLKEPDKISPGKVLIIPRAGTSVSGRAKPLSGAGAKHIVQKGETVWGIAKKYGVKPEEIIAVNKLRKPDEISPGQELIIPGLVSPRARQQEIVSLCRLPRGVRARKWRYIVIHHSATKVGSAPIFDRYHRRLGMKNGLAYHFVIGNGSGSGDGEIDVGGRWTKQLHGGHCGNWSVNRVGIGICLVGDFQKTYPTRKQMESLVLLLKYLVRKCNIPKTRVIGHRDVPGGDTKCPGKHFSLGQVRRRL